METNSTKQYHIKQSDLPLYCPTPSMELWNTHPRVFLELKEKGSVNCPYCGTQFILDNDVQETL